MQQPGQEQQEQRGVVFGYRTLGDFGDGAGHLYYFGRSRQRALYELSTEGLADGLQVRQKKALRTKCRRVGLNAPKRVLLWGRSEDVDRDWDELKSFLRGHRRTNNVVRITNQVWVGDNFFSCEDMGPTDFGLWLRTVWDRVIYNQEDAEEEEEPQPPVEQEQEEQPPVSESVQVEVFRDSNLLVNRLLELRQGGLL